MTEDSAPMTAVMRRLRAVREFTADPVSSDAIEEILSVARWSGSAQNRQPWRFVVIRSADTLRALAGLVPNAPQLGRAPLAIAVVMPGEKAVLDAFDEGRVVERILLAAAAVGLGAGLGWVPQEARARAASLLGVPPERLVRSIVAIGHPAAEALRPRSRPGTARLPLDELVHDEAWRGRS